MPSLLRLTACLALLALPACVNVPMASNLPPAPKEIVPELPPAPALEPYHIQVGDLMDIKLLLNPEMNEQVMVRPDGKISTAAARNVLAYGRTTEELEADLEKRYHKHLRNPEVSVIVRSFAPNRVYVTGEVNTPGEFVTVGPNLTLMQAIARAGGVRNSALTDKIVILRRGASEKAQAYVASYDAAASGMDPSSDVRLAPYDVVYVPRSTVGDVYVNYQQYIQQFVPFNFSAVYDVSNSSSIISR